MDKLKVQAEQVAKQAQQGVAQGQSKIGEMQAKRAADALLHDLGAAVYAAQRQGGPHEPIETIMAALDAHAAAHGGIDTANTPPPAATGAPASADGSPAPTPPAGNSTPTGDFKMDDL
ncbi:MAG: hypothetical protein QOI76_3425 [Frankiales bacterium]|jgi:hypothetical protein|nr:hypothetical protein [Frankiales bacterium]